MADRRTLLGLAAGVAMGLAGCLGDTLPGTERGTVAAADPDISEERIDPDVSISTIRELATAQRHFAIALHQTLVADQPDSNHVTSPLSIGVALAMASAGARGETVDEMADAVSFPFEQDELHEVFN